LGLGVRVGLVRKDKVSAVGFRIRVGLWSARGADVLMPRGRGVNVLNSAS